MKNWILLILVSILISCTSKKEKIRSKNQNQSSTKEVNKKLSGKEIIDSLEKLGFFALTDKNELQEVKIDFEKSYVESNFFLGKLRGETTDFKDNRFYWIDCEELFEVGGLTEYLSHVQRSFIKLGLKLEFNKEKSEQNQNSWKHTIELNGNEYVAFDGQFSDLDWGIAYVNFIEMLNSELRKQGSNEQFYPISCGNNGSFVLLTTKQFDFVSKNYPNDNEHPSEISSWKRINGL